MTQKFIVDPLKVRGLQNEVNKNLWASYENQNPAYIDCLVGFHKMNMKDRMRLFGIKFNEHTKTSHLTELYHKDEFFIDKCGGDIESCLYSASDLFTGYLSSNLKDWNLINSQPRTEKARMKIFEMHKDGDYRTLFGSFNTDLEKLCMTQAQIKIFCKNHKEKLRKDGYGTFFLFRERNEFFVAGVNFGDGRLGLSVSGFADDGVWYASRQHRVVVPATALNNSEI